MQRRTEKAGFSVIQSTEDYESVDVYHVAVRPQDDFGNPLKKQVSLETSGIGTMEKVLTTVSLEYIVNCNFSLSIFIYMLHKKKNVLIILG